MVLIHSSRESPPSNHTHTHTHTSTHTQTYIRAFASQLLHEVEYIEGFDYGPFYFGPQRRPVTKAMMMGTIVEVRPQKRQGMKRWTYTYTHTHSARGRMEGRLHVCVYGDEIISLL